jgi:hypothetical protein
MKHHLRNLKNKKSQVEMGETILTLFVFVVLFVIVILFFLRLNTSSGAIEELQKKQATTYSEEIIKYVENMNEIACPNSQSESTLCIDLLSFIVLKDKIKSNTPVYEHYYDYLKTSNITLNIAYWWNIDSNAQSRINKSYTLYEETLKETETGYTINYFPTYIPVIVHDPIFNKNMLGTLTITYTAKSVTSK